MISRYVLAASAALAIATALPASAKFTPPPMPAGYDDAGPKPDDVLPILARALKRQLYDPYSVRDLIVCHPIQGQAYAPTYKGSVWRPASWLVNFALNGRNRFGGYVGQSDGYAHIRYGEVIDFSLTERKPPEQDYEVTLAQFTERMLSHCNHIPDAEYQRALESARLSPQAWPYSGGSLSVAGSSPNSSCSQRPRLNTKMWPCFPTQPKFRISGPSVSQR